MTVLIVFRIVRQIKKQLDMKQKARLKENFRVTIALCAQSLALTIFTIIEASDAAYASTSYIRNFFKYEALNFFLHGKWIVDEMLQTCILFNSIITLFFMSGYRGTMVDFAKYGCRTIAKILDLTGIYTSQKWANSVGSSIVHSNK